MRVEFLTNNDISLSLADWLKQSEGEQVLINKERLNPESLKRRKPDLVVSYNYRYIIPPDVLGILPGKFINLHISLLPWNRGADPNFWSFVENSPKGVTIHLIDKGIDTGGILLQKEVLFNEEEETLASSYHKLHQALQDLFESNWTRIRNFEIVPQTQTKEGGSTHYLKDFARIKSILGDEGWNIPIPLLKKRFNEIK